MNSPAPFLPPEALQLVKWDEINRVHFEEVALINEIHFAITSYEDAMKKENYENLKTCENEVLKLANKLYDHSIYHFSNEERLMVEYDFFAYHCHHQAHQDALKEMAAVLQELEKSRNVAQFKTYITQDLLEWIVQHIATMDEVTANFIYQQSLKASDCGCSSSCPHL